MDAPLLVYVRAEGCGVCVERAPLVERLAGEEGLPLQVLDLGDPEGRARAQALRISAIPTLALVQDERARFRLVGRMITPENVRHLLTFYLPTRGGAA
jgi:thiol-disulfide isomerase/thioredoxin